MDNHPIPQDVTGFQFRLIGDMTVKQFAYVAVGGIFAVVFLYAPIPFLLRIPLMILSGAIGAILAFVPLEGRPVDQMVGYFIKALITPNQYAFQKTGGTIPIFSYNLSKTQSIPSASLASGLPIAQPQDKVSAQEKEQKLKTYLSMHQSTPHSQLDKHEDEFINRLFSTSPQPAQPAPQVQETPPAQPVTMTPAPDPTSVPEPETPPAQPPEPVTEKEVEEELVQAHREEDQEQDKEKKAAAHAHAEELEKQLSGIRRQKEELEKQLQSLRAQNEAPKEAIEEPQEIVKAPLQTPPQTQTPTVPATVRKISSEMAKDLGLPHLPEVPNLIIGIVKDSRGNALSNILVEVKDKDGNPARAFRTNQLGQFASATPLAEGIYNIYFEDPKGQHSFDTVEINAEGEIIMPIEIISHDAREELRKALFN